MENRDVLNKVFFLNKAAYMYSVYILKLKVQFTSLLTECLIDSFPSERERASNSCRLLPNIVPQNL